MPIYGSNSIIALRHDSSDLMEVTEGCSLLTEGDMLWWASVVAAT